MRIYLDHNATTPVDPELIGALGSALANFGNPSSIHWASREPKRWLREARGNLSRLLGVHPLEIIFNSGASEGNNTVIRTFARLALENARQGLPCELITSQIEHPSVAKVFDWAESLGVKVHRIGVSISGHFDWSHFNEVLGPQSLFVSIMFANNETGTLLPVAEITRLAKKYGVFVHSDMVQALGKIPVTLASLGLDYASFSGHKFYSLKGTGVLFSRKGAPLDPFVLGGPQERFRRGGTENSIGIFSLGFCAKRIEGEVASKASQMEKLRDLMEQKILSQIEAVKINGLETPRLPNTSSLLIEGVDGESLLMSLDLEGFAVSTGAACSSGSPEPSPVLLAMGLTRAEAQTSLRVSLGWHNTEEEVLAFVEALKKSVERIRSVLSTKAPFPLGSDVEMVSHAFNRRSLSREPNEVSP
jgi:cysteine desulfurase